MSGFVIGICDDSGSFLVCVMLTNRDKRRDC